MSTFLTGTLLTVNGSVELSILLKATLVLALGFGTVWLARRARASARHLAITATYAALLLLPLLVLYGPSVAIEVVAPDVGAFVGPVSEDGGSSGIAEGTLELSHEAQPSFGTAMMSTLRWGTVIRVAWAAGGLALLAWLAVHLWRLRRLRLSGVPWPEALESARVVAARQNVRRPIQLLLHEGIRAPLACGIWRPAIILPADAVHWRSAELNRALSHELEHIRRADWATQLIARLICIGYWFHPLVWVAARRLSLEAERAADDAVIQRRDDSAEYAEQLVVLARKMSAAGAYSTLGMANRSDLSTRISALLDGRQRRGRVGIPYVVGALALSLATAIAIAPLRTVAQPAASVVAAAQTEGDPGANVTRALLEAAGEGQAEATVSLLDGGADPDTSLSGEGTPLVISAREGHSEIVGLLLDRGADPDLVVDDVGSPLTLASREGRTEVVQMLLDRGADPNQVVVGGGSPLTLASREGRTEVVRMLLDRGANPNLVIEGTDSPLALATREGRTEVVDLLLERMAGEQQ